MHSVTLHVMLDGITVFTEIITDASRSVVNRKVKARCKAIKKANRSYEIDAQRAKHNP